MKRSKLYYIAVVLAATLLAVSILAACGNSGEAGVASDDGSAASEKYTVDGVEITSIAVEMVGSTPNLQIVFSNGTDSAVMIDISKFAIKTGDGQTFFVSGLEKEIAANTPYSQNALTFMNDPGVKVGDEVGIYYGDDLIKTTVVTEF